MMTDINEKKRMKDFRKEIAIRQQNQASDPKHSVWVEASAGTGKTKVLSDRVLRLLLEGVSPSKILCLTYTKAAAVEMNTRIAMRLSKWAIMEENELYKEISALTGAGKAAAPFPEMVCKARTLFAALLDIPGGMKIQTIHSFCQEVLKKFPIEAGITPYFTVMDDRMTVEALNQVSNNLILKLQNEQNSPSGKAIAFLTYHIREFKFTDLFVSLTASRTRFVQILKAYPSLNVFLETLRKKLDIPESGTPERAMESFVASLDENQINVIIAGLEKGSAGDVKNAKILRKVLDNGWESFDYENFKAVFLTKSGTIYSVLAHKEAVKACPNIIEIMQKQAEAILSLENYLRRLKLYESTRSIMTIASELIEDYNRYKKLHSYVDYEDLILITRQLLENPSVADWVLFKLDGGIDHILIDEAQDTSPHQWAIIKSLTNEFFSGLGQCQEQRTIFAVGDRKQSIYSFQGADPAEFDNMFKYFSSQEANFKKIRLDVSFRSTETVLEAVNRVFSSAEAKGGVVPEGENIEHIPFRLGDGGTVEIWPLIEGDEDAAEVWYPPVERKTKETASLKLAREIALRIKKMVENGELLESQGRPLRYGDFMILVQRRNIFIEELVRMCKSLGVSVSGVDKIKITDHIAVQDLLSLGKFLLLPQDDLSLAEVLKSPLCGLNDDDLFHLCHNRGSFSLWSRLNAEPKYQSLTQMLSELLIRASYNRPFELFDYVLTSLKGRKKFIARLGLDCEDALDEFINLSVNFEVHHIPDLQTFMQWISSGDVEIKRELEQPDIDAVRLMTVHGSKGLQAPVVILPDTTRIANVKKGNGLLWSADNMAYFPLAADDYDTICSNIHEAEKEKAFEEYRRLLYVALTRAEDRLYICGYKSKTDINDKSWYNLCYAALAKYGIKAPDGSVSMCAPQSVKIDERNKKTPFAPAVVPEDWLFVDAPAEMPLARPLSPSKSDEDDGIPAASPLLTTENYYRRGIIIHRLLQFLPVTKGNPQVSQMMALYLNKYAADLTPESRDSLKTEVINLLNNPEHAFIFGKDSKAEVPIMGEVDGRIITAQIDRLVVGAQKVTIVDFKTNRPVTQNLQLVPQKYLKQLEMYKKIVEKIYVDKQVEAYILWTNTGQLMKIF